jgi:8-oxo-dGTP diphosphatase
LTEEELEDGLQHKWVYVDVAIKLMKDAKPVPKLGLSIKKRGLFFAEKLQPPLNLKWNLDKLWG